MAIQLTNIVSLFLGGTMIWGALTVIFVNYFFFDRPVTKRDILAVSLIVFLELYKQAMVGVVGS